MSTFSRVRWRFLTAAVPPLGHPRRCAPVVVLHPVPVDLLAAGLVRPGDHRVRRQGFIGAVIAAFIFFGSILLHELGHALAARREGIGVGGIDLFFFGGFMRATARLRDAGRGVPRRRGRPGGHAAAVRGLRAPPGWRCSAAPTALLDAATFEFASGSLLEVVVAFSALANAALFLLNIVPAFPLDGGRIARAFVWQVTGDRHRATKFAAYMGQGFARADDGLGRLRARQRLRTAATRSTACGGSCSAG